VYTGVCTGETGDRQHVAHAQQLAAGLPAAGRTRRMRQKEGGHAACQRARDPGGRLCQLVPRLQARGRFSSELLTLREAVWRAHSVPPGHEHLLGGRHGDQQRREARVQGATASQRGGRAAGECGWPSCQPAACLFLHACPSPARADPCPVQGTYLGSS